MSLPGARVLSFATAAFVLGLAGASVLAPSAPSAPLLERATRLPDGPSVPELTLVDENGTAFGASRFRGRWTYVFFGYTSCPDVCPTTLTVLAEARRTLADLPPELRPGVLLVTVDPARDDPARLAAFVRHFDAGFHAVTGDAPGVDGLVRALKAGYARVPLPGGGYTMDHSASLFLVGPQGRLVATSGAPHDAAVIARDYRALVAGNPGPRPRR